PFFVSSAWRLRANIVRQRARHQAVCATCEPATIDLAAVEIVPLRETRFGEKCGHVWPTEETDPGFADRSEGGQSFLMPRLNRRWEFIARLAIVEHDLGSGRHARDRLQRRQYGIARQVDGDAQPREDCRLAQVKVCAGEG